MVSIECYPATVEVPHPWATGRMVVMTARDREKANYNL
jgi:hypothetical protein